MSSFKDLMAAQAAVAAREKKELELAQQKQREREKQMQEDKAKRAKQEEERQKQLRALARLKEKEGAQLEERRAKEAEEAARTGVVQKRLLIAEAKSLGLVKSKVNSDRPPRGRDSASNLHGAARTPREAKPTVQLSQAERRKLRAAREFEDSSSPAARRKALNKVLSGSSPVPAGRPGGSCEVVRKDAARSSPSTSDGPKLGSGQSKEVRRGTSGHDKRNGELSNKRSSLPAQPTSSKTHSPEDRKHMKSKESRTDVYRNGKPPATSSSNRSDIRTAGKRRATPSEYESDDSIDSDDLDRATARRNRDERDVPRKRPRREEERGGSRVRGGGSILAQHGLDISQLFGRRPSRERYDDDVSSSDMEADAETIRREEARAAKLAREADRIEEEREMRRAEEKRRRKLEAMKGKQ